MVTEQLHNGFYIHVHGAAERMQDDWERRYVPSPSGIGACRLQQWFNGSGVERTNRVPVDSMKKMESGTAIEGFWREVYTRAGFLVVSPTPPLAIGAMRSKGGDGILFVETDDCAKAIGMPKGASLLLELKDFGSWSYMDFVQKGCQEAMPDYWAQVQAYLYGFDREYCILHAGMADVSSTKFIWRRIRKYEGDPPPFWIEIIKRDDSVTLASIERAGDVRNAIDNITDRVPVELRDYDAPKLVMDNKFPCGWCGWKEACLNAGKVIPITEFQTGGQ